MGAYSSISADRRSGSGPRPGDRMPDGTVYAGALDGRAIYTAPKDAPLTYTFNEAAKYARKLCAEKYLGHDDWRVPTEAELNVLFQNKAAIGGFNVSGSGSAGWYWSSTSAILDAWARRFGDGGVDGKYKNAALSLRCVR